jgi:AcrR family transcriptional regulator
METRQMSTRSIASPQLTNRLPSNRKEQLRDAALAYLVEQGLTGVSLRPMAAQLGTSARILIFHFKSKEGLMTEVMEELHARLQASFLKLSESPDRSVPPLKRFWLWARDRKNFAYLRLLYESQIVAARDGKLYGRHLKKSSTDWQRLVFQRLSESVRSQELATLCIAVFDGLFLELIVTGDRLRLTRAMDYFIVIARSPRSDSKSKPEKARATRPS